jgi:PHD/YefM family antitoxin component YafN of YafNO toxin-antitoxin module
MAGAVPRDVLKALFETGARLMNLHPSYITDESGRRVSAVLPIEEYQALLERLEDLEDLAEARAVLERIDQDREETIPWEAVKIDHRSDTYR